MHKTWTHELPKLQNKTISLILNSTDRFRLIPTDYRMIRIEKQIVRGRLRTITDDYGRLRTIRENEKQILLYFLDNKSISRKIAIELLSLQKTKVHEIITGLVGNNLIEKQGQGRSTYYTLVN